MVTRHKTHRKGHASYNNTPRKEGDLLSTQLNNDNFKQTATGNLHVRDCREGGTFMKGTFNKYRHGLFTLDSMLILLYTYHITNKLFILYYYCLLYTSRCV